MRIFQITILLYILFIFLSACDSSETTALEPRFTSINNQVFANSCLGSACHNGAAQAGNLVLSEEDSYKNLINVQSNFDSESLLVTPFLPEESYLINVLESGTNATNNGPHNNIISQDFINIIRTWISQGAVVATLDSIQSQVFSQQCTLCHSGEFPAASLNLEPGKSRGSLINVERSFGTELRVKVGDANNSFLIDKLEGNNLGNDRGSQMPLNAEPLPQAVIDTIREWVDLGAD